MKYKNLLLTQRKAFDFWGLPLRLPDQRRPRLGHSPKPPTPPMSASYSTPNLGCLDKTSYTSYPHMSLSIERVTRVWTMKSRSSSCHRPTTWTAWYYSKARRPSSVCPPGNFLRKSLLLRDKWLACNKTWTRWSTGPIACAQGQRSRDTGTFVLARKSLLLPR